MLNAGRQIDFAIFTLDQSVEIDGLILEPGLQQIFRMGNMYQFKKVSSKEPYVEIPLTNNIAVLRALFSKEMFTGM